MKWNITLTVPNEDSQGPIDQERLQTEVGMICSESFELDADEYTVEVAPAEAPAAVEAPAEEEPGLRTGTEG